MSGIGSVEHDLLADRRANGAIRRGSMDLIRRLRAEHPERFPELAIPKPSPRVSFDLGPPIRLSDSFATRLIEAVASYYHIRPADITGPRRWSYFVEARSLVATTLRARGWYYPRIGRLMNRDHTSVLNLCKKIDIFCKRSEECRDAYEALEPYRTKP